MKNMSCGISVFPEYDNPQDIQRVKQYIEKAASLGYTEVFGSLHIPEQDVSSSIGAIAELGTFVREKRMDFSLDVSGHMLNRMLDSEETRTLLATVPISWLRMDFAFNFAAIMRAVSSLNLEGLMLNASVLSADDLEALVPAIQETLKVDLRAHHNYYPRPETGLSMDFMTQRSLQYQRYDIPVTACIASLNAPRQPLFAGLPTVEEHRNMPCEEAALSLRASGVIDSVLIGDDNATDAELRSVWAVCDNAPVELPVLLEPGVSEKERAIIFAAAHHARPDAAECAIRSQSSREMAAMGTDIEPRPARPRKRGDVTIDNTGYLRYSGELQVLTQDLDADARVNIVGHLSPDAMKKLDYIIPGTDFIFTE